MVIRRFRLPEWNLVITWWLRTRLIAITICRETLLSVPAPCGLRGFPRCCINPAESRVDSGIQFRKPQLVFVSDPPVCVNRLCGVTRRSKFIPMASLGSPRTPCLSAGSFSLFTFFKFSLMKWQHISFPGVRQWPVRSCQKGHLTGDGIFTFKRHDLTDFATTEAYLLLKAAIDRLAEGQQRASDSCKSLNGLKWRSFWRRNYHEIPSSILRSNIGPELHFVVVIFRPPIPNTFFPIARASLDHFGVFWYSSDFGWHIIILNCRHKLDRAAGARVTDESHEWEK